MKMLIRSCWLSSLFFITATTALSSSSSHHTSISSTKKSTVPSSSTRHLSTSTIKKSSTTPISTHHTSSSSARSTTTTPTPSSTPSTFYLVAENTRQSHFDGYYFKLIINPYPTITTSGARALQFAGKTPHGPATFSLTADGALRCNDVSGPLYAGVDNGHPETQTLQFEHFENPEEGNESGSVTATCAIGADRVLTCQWGPLVDFYYDDSDVVNGTQVGEIVALGLPGDSTPFTIKVVPT